MPTPIRAAGRSLHHTAGRPKPGLLAVGLLSALLLGSCGADRSEVEPPLLVFAAASLTDVLTELRGAYLTGHPEAQIELHVGASSLLARQLHAGAPGGLFLSAHPEWIDSLRDAGLLRRSERVPVGNRLVVVGPAEAGSSADRSWWAAGRVAVGDPAHVPVGRYAEEALRCMGLWDTLSERLIPTLDARAAVAAVETGAAELALAYATDVVENPRVEVRAGIPPSCRPDIRYEAGVLGNDEARTADAFLDFVIAPEQARYWRAAGFDVEAAPVDTTRPPTNE